MRITVELDRYQKSNLYDRLKEEVKDIVVDEAIHYSDYLRLIETLERDEVE